MIWDILEIALIFYACAICVAWGWLMRMMFERSTGEEKFSAIDCIFAFMAATLWPFILAIDSSHIRSTPRSVDALERKVSRLSFRIRELDGTDPYYGDSFHVSGSSHRRFRKLDDAVNDASMGMNIVEVHRTRDLPHAYAIQYMNYVEAFPDIKEALKRIKEVSSDE